MGFKIKLDGYAFVQSLVKAGVAATFTSFLGSTVVATPPAAAAVAVGTAAAAAAAGTAGDNPIVKAISDAAGSAFKLTEGDKGMQERLAKAVEDSLEHAFASVEGDAKALMPITEEVKRAVKTAASGGYQNFGPGSDVDARAYLHAIIRHACDASHDGSLMGEEVRERIVSVFFETLGQNMLKDDLLGRKFLMEVINAHGDAMLWAVAEVYAKVGTLQEETARILEQLQQLGDGSSQGDRDAELLSRMGTVMRQVLDEHAARDGAHAPSPDVSDLLTHCRDRLGKQRDNHPSFKLMRGDSDESAHPKARPIPNAKRLASVDGGEPTPLSDVFRGSWQSEGQCHLYITGPGGVGKTVALLTFATEEGFLPRGVPAVYIPLYELAQYHNVMRDCIDAYLRTTFPDDKCVAIDRLSHKPWDGGPSLILLLDGHNEVPADVRDDVNMGIRKWAERGGTQVVTTSRIPGLADMADTRQVELRGLGKDDAKAYLFECGLDLPDDDGNLWRVLETPLMLRLYADVKTFSKRMSDPYVSLEKSNSAGHLVWNYLQRELWRVIKWNKGDFSKVEYAAALLLTLPYVCWRMEAAHEFRVDVDRLERYVQEACERWLTTARPRGFAATERRLRSRLGSVDVDGLADSQLAILSDETGLLAWNGEGYSLLHQSLRDGFAAIHLKNAMEAPYVELPDEFKQSISEYVKDFLADVCEDEPLGALWETNRATLPTDVTATHNLLRVIHRRRNGDLTALDWSGMDLRGMSLFPFRKETKLEASTKPERFAGTKMDRACFMPHRHSERVLSVCFSPDGKMLASGSWDGEVRFWDAVAMRQVLPTFDCDGLCVASMRFSPDGRIVAVGTREGTAYLLRVASGKPLGEPMQVGSGINSVCFSPDGALLALGSDDGRVVLWDVRKGSPAPHALEAGSPVRSVCFSPDGHLLAGGSKDGAVRLWDIETGVISAPSLEADTSVRSVCFSPDGSSVAVGYDGSVWVWDSRTRSVAETPLEATFTTFDVCYAKSGALYALSNSDGIAHLLDASGCESNSAPIEIGTWVHCACLSPDGSYVACGYGVDGVRILATATAEVVWSSAQDTSRWDASLSVSSDGSKVAVETGDGMLRLWSPETGSMTARPLEVGDDVISHCFSPDGMTLAVAWDSFVSLWDAQTGQPAASPLKGEGCRAIRSVLFSPDGSLLAAVFFSNLIEPDIDCGVCVWNTRTSEMLVGPGLNAIQLTGFFWFDDVFPCFSPDGSRLAVGHGHGIQVLDSTTGAVIVERLGHQEKACPRCFSPDGSLLAAEYDDAVCIWDVETGDLVTSVGARGIRVRFARFSPDGTRLAVGYKKGVIILNLESGSVVGSSHEPEVSYGPATYLSDGTLVATGIADGELRVWRFTTGEARCAMPKNSERIASCKLSENGELLVAMGYDGTVSLWRTRDLLDDIPETGPTHTLEALQGIDVFGLDFSLASIEDSHDQEVLRQNGAKVKSPRGATSHTANRNA